MSKDNKKKNNGFSLFEVLVVLGILSPISVGVFFLSFMGIARDLCNAQVSSVYRIIFHARERAAVSYFQGRSVVGVVFRENDIVVYKGFSPETDFEPELFPLVGASFHIFASPGVLFVPDKNGIRAASTTVQIFGPSCDRSIHIDEIGAIT